MHCILVFHILFVAADLPYSLRSNTLKATRHDDILPVYEIPREDWAKLPTRYFKEHVQRMSAYNDCKEWYKFILSNHRMNPNRVDASMG